jgi:CheY-like chemotaxis protein
VPYRPETPKKINKDFPSKSVVIGEDDLDDEELLKELFFTIDPSYRLTFINNGKNLVNHLADLAENDRPCLIVLDYNMPGLTGAEILAELKKCPALEGVPRLIWSTSQSDTYRGKCFDSGANDYLIKPPTVDGLFGVIKHMLSFC